ncbi:Uncharacterised protein [Klebsiella aerogenes]|nr:Uncharacterised protein [Klebsiella aerogenes]
MSFTSLLLYATAFCVNHQIDALIFRYALYSSLDAGNQFATLFVGTTCAILFKRLRFLGEGLALSHHVFFQFGTIGARLHGLQTLHFRLQVAFHTLQFASAGL